MIEIKVQSDGITAALQSLLLKLHDLSPVMKEISGIMMRAVEDNFRDGGRPEWEKSKRVKKHGGQTLIKTTRLVTSIKPKSSSTQAIVSTNCVYAAIHQFGGTITTNPYRRTLAFTDEGRFRSKKASANRGKTGAVRVAFANYGSRTFTMPARPFLSMTEGDMADVMTTITKYLTI